MKRIVITILVTFSFITESYPACAKLAMAAKKIPTHAGGSTAAGSANLLVSRVASAIGGRRDALKFPPVRIPESFARTLFADKEIQARNWSEFEKSKNVSSYFYGYQLSLSEKQGNVILVIPNSQKVGDGMSTPNQPMYIYKRDGKRFREMLDVVGTTIVKLPTATLGYHDILVLQHYSYQDDDVLLCKYSKGKYKTTNCFRASFSKAAVPSVKMLKCSEMD